MATDPSSAVNLTVVGSLRDLESPVDDRIIDAVIGALQMYKTWRHMGVLQLELLAGTLRPHGPTSMVHVLNDLARFLGSGPNAR